MCAAAARRSMCIGATSVRSVPGSARYLLRVSEHRRPGTGGCAGTGKDTEAVRSRYARLIQERLEGARLKVIGPELVGPIMSTEAAKVGGLYDPVTGKIDDSQRKAFVQACGVELFARYGVDALLRADVRVVKASVAVYLGSPGLYSYRCISCGAKDQQCCPGVSGNSKM